MASLKLCFAGARLRSAHPAREGGLLGLSGPAPARRISVSGQPCHVDFDQPGATSQCGALGPKLRRALGSLNAREPSLQHAGRVCRRAGLGAPGLGAAPPHPNLHPALGSGHAPAARRVLHAQPQRVAGGQIRPTLLRTYDSLRSRRTLKMAATLGSSFIRRDEAKAIYPPYITSSTRGQRTRLWQRPLSCKAGVNNGCRQQGKGCVVAV